MNNAIISLKGIQTNVDDETTTIELVSEASFYKKENSYYIVYKETQITGMDGTTTTVKVTKDTVNLIRFGSVCSKMVFKEGFEHVSTYDTIYGSLDICVSANVVDIKMNDEGGELYIDYDIQIGGKKLGINNFYIKVVDKREE